MILLLRWQNIIFLTLMNSKKSTWTYKKWRKILNYKKSHYFSSNYSKIWILSNRLRISKTYL